MSGFPDEHEVASRNRHHSNQPGSLGNPHPDAMVRHFVTPGHRPGRPREADLADGLRQYEIEEPNYDEENFITEPDDGLQE